MEKVENYKGIIQSVELSLSSFNLAGVIEARAWKTGEGADVSFRRGHEEPKFRHITDAEWESFIDRLLNKYRVFEWKKNYTPKDYLVCDGDSWLLKLGLESRRRRTWHGDNVFPPNWDKIVAEFERLAE